MKIFGDGSIFGVAADGRTAIQLTCKQCFVEVDVMDDDEDSKYLNKCLEQGASMYMSFRFEDPDKAESIIVGHAKAKGWLLVKKDFFCPRCRSEFEPLETKK